MSHDLLSSLSKPEILATLTVEQLVDIVVQQQQLIEQLQRDERCTPTQETRGKAIPHSRSPFTDTKNDSRSQPCLQIQTDSGSCHVPPG